jgi:hypothetical protein
MKILMNLLLTIYLNHMINEEEFIQLQQFK